MIHQLLLQETIDLTELNQEVVDLDDFLPNEGLHLLNGSEANEDLLAIYREEDKHFQILERLDNVWGVKPRNPEQRLAMEYLLIQRSMWFPSQENQEPEKPSRPGCRTTVDADSKSLYQDVGLQAYFPNGTGFGPSSRRRAGKTRTVDAADF